MSRPLARAALTAGLALGLLTAVAGPAAAHPEIGLPPTLPSDLTYSSTDNVDHLGRFPEHSGTAGGHLSQDGTRFYVTDPRGVHVYDASNPRDPRRLGSLPLFQQETGAALAQEDPDTDDHVLLVDGAATPVGTAQLNVVDVSDPTAMRVLATLPVTDHTWTCVSAGEQRCAYAYGRTGWIVDLRVPTAPKLLDTTWRKAVGYGDRSNSPYAHDLTEVRPGVVLAVGSNVLLLDTRNPARPVLLNRLDQSARFPSLGFHSAEWPRGGADRFLVLGTEIAPSGPTNTAGSDCRGEESVIETWDARAVRDALDAYLSGDGSLSAVRSARFTRVDAYSVSGRGIFLSGAAPAHVLYCAHWMEPSPRFSDGGLLAVSYYDRGTRFVQVGSDGRMSERGWLVAAEGYSGSPQWVTDSVVYVMDYRRGLEVVELHDRPATRVRQLQTDVVALGSVRVVGASAVPPGRAVLPLAAAGLLLLLAGNVVALRRRARAGAAAAGAGAGARL